jgi:hypothetical protein
MFLVVFADIAVQNIYLMAGRAGGSRGSAPSIPYLNEARPTTISSEGISGRRGAIGSQGYSALQHATPYTRIGGYAQWPIRRLPPAYGLRTNRQASRSTADLVRLALPSGLFYCPLALIRELFAIRASIKEYP